MNYPQPMVISAVRAHPEFSNVITITDNHGQDWHYLQTGTGELMLGFPVQLYDKVTRAAVYVFHPLGPGNIPVLIKVVLPDDPH